MSYFFQPSHLSRTERSSIVKIALFVIFLHLLVLGFGTVWELQTPAAKLRPSVVVQTIQLKPQDNNIARSNEILPPSEIAPPLPQQEPLPIAKEEKIELLLQDKPVIEEPVALIEQTVKNETIPEPPIPKLHPTPVPTPPPAPHSPTTPHPAESPAMNKPVPVQAPAQTPAPKSPPPVHKPKNNPIKPIETNKKPAIKKVESLKKEKKEPVAPKLKTEAEKKQEKEEAERKKRAEAEKKKQTEIEKKKQADAEKKRQEERAEAEKKRMQEAEIEKKRQQELALAKEAARQKEQQALNKAKENFAKVGETRGKISSALPTQSQETTLPTTLGSLQVEALSLGDGNTQGGKWGTKETSYSDDVAYRLKMGLCLPDYGAVTIKLTLDRSGKVLAVETLESKSAKNKAYAETKIPTLAFPAFGQRFQDMPKNTFIYTLKNDS